MITAAIICEYDPFHFGHKRQIDIIRQSLGEDTVVISLMSGSTVQRGRFSVYPKHVRALAALKNGSDLVLELPCPYSCSGAEGFARGAVSILNGLGNIDYLVFGSESGDIASLMKCADIINSEEYIEALKNADNDNSHIKKCKDAFKRLGGINFPTKPNDILAVEYIAAIKKTKSTIIPFTYKREEGYSATAARLALYNEDDLSSHIPENALEIFANNELTDYEKYEKIAMYKIISTDAEELSGYYGMNGGVASLIKKNSERAESYNELISLCTSKTYTSSRIRRAIMSAVLNIKEEDVKSPPLFTNLLASNENGRKYLSSIKKTSGIKVITKPAEASRLREDIKKQFEMNLQSDKLMSLVRNKASNEAIKKSPAVV